jgi:outer membrane immunogenic protein
MLILEPCVTRVQRFQDANGATMHLDLSLTVNVPWGHDMNRLLATSVALLSLLSGSAVAADMGMPLKAPPPPPPAPTWTGCYINGGGGYGMSNIDHTLETFPGLVALNANGTDGGRGWLGTVGGGCDYQFPVAGLGNFVVGVFGDYNFMNIHGQVEDSVTILQGDANLSSTWAAGARLGFLVTPSLLTYVNGGYTGAHFDQVNMSFYGIGAAMDYLPATNYSGWFIGGGTEYALNFSWLPIQGLFWRNEYRFSQYNTVDLDRLVVGTGAATGIADHFGPYVQTITSSLVWRFNWFGR